MILVLSNCLHFFWVLMPCLFIFPVLGRSVFQILRFVLDLVMIRHTWGRISHQRNSSLLWKQNKKWGALPRLTCMRGSFWQQNRRWCVIFWGNNAKLPVVSCLFTNEQISGCKGDCKVRPVVGATSEHNRSSCRFSLFTFLYLVNLPFLRARTGFLFPRECFSTDF